LPGSSAESNVNDGETAISERKKLENNLTKEKKEEKAANKAKQAVKDSTVKDVVKDVNDKDQKINDKVTEDQFGRDITGPKSERTEPNRLEQGNSELHGNRPQDSADFANKNKITGPDLVSPGEKGSEAGSTPPSQPPLASGTGQGGATGIGGFGGGGSGVPGLTGPNPIGTQPGTDMPGSGQVTPPTSEPFTPPTNGTEGTPQTNESQPQQNLPSLDWGSAEARENG